MTVTDRGLPPATAGSALGGSWAHRLGGVAAHRFREDIHPAGVAPQRARSTAPQVILDPLPTG
ncbi:MULTISPECIES: hypothetical protein [unclassified Streptomyces]|uniref:hypothetical protein n=1 Tax=unclassified Streptomyces TaxID=2593676 RepID=UPI0036DFEA0C